MEFNHLLHITLMMVITLNAAVYCNEIQLTAKMRFPDLFKMDDFYKCPEDSDFCTATLKLVPHNATCKIWADIEDWSKNHNHFNRTTLFRTMCILKPFQNESEKRQFVEDKVNDELTLYNVSSKMYSIRCMEPKKFDVNIKLYMTILASYLILVLIATIYDETIYDKRINESKLAKLLVCFSATNFKKANIKKTRDYQRLKCIQGIRTYLATLVIMGHTLLNFQQKNISNPEYVEYLSGQIYMQYLIVFAMFVLQIFFFISVWLLTTRILVMHKENGKFTIKDGCLLLIHRIARIWPVLVAMMFIGIPLFNYYGYGPGNFEVATMTNQACNNNWWITFLFATDLLESDQACHLGMWSLTLDIRFHVLTTIFLYTVLKYNLNIKKSMAVLFLICYVATSAQIYSKELYRNSFLNINHLTNLNLFLDNKLWYIYFGFWSSTCSGVVGMLFGYIYFSTKENPEKPEPFEKYYKAISIVLPILAVLIANPDYGKLTAVLIGPLYKTLFSFGIALGIYGMSRNVIQGAVKSLCENKYAVQLGDTTFCTYIFHFFIIFMIESSSSSTIELGVLKVFAVTVKNLIVSFPIGAIATIIIEIPGVYLKNLILPPVTKKTRPDNQAESNNNRRKKLN